MKDTPEQGQGNEAEEAIKGALKIQVRKYAPTQKLPGFGEEQVTMMANYIYVTARDSGKPMTLAKAEMREVKWDGSQDTKSQFEMFQMIRAALDWYNAKLKEQEEIAKRTLVIDKRGFVAGEVPTPGKVLNDAKERGKDALPSA